MSNPYNQPGPPGPAPHMSPAPAAPDARPLYKRKRVWAGGVLLLLVGTSCGAMGADDNSKTAAAEAKPGPTVTATATVTATPTPTVTAKARPAPTVTKTVTATATVTVTKEAADYGSSSSDGSGSVYYSNCAEARAAGATPVHRGEPGYGAHLDRDGDGTGCDWG
ncbi:excalibur calcium-binding domain-containing protein [Streptomyces sp. NPDC005151]